METLSLMRLIPVYLSQPKTTPTFLAVEELRHNTLGDEHEQGQTLLHFHNITQNVHTVAFKLY